MTLYFKKPKKGKGFSLIELILVISLFGGILTLVIPNLIRPISTTKLDATEKEIISLIREAQNKSMNKQGQNPTDLWGVHFEPNKMILFKAPFNSSSTENFEVKAEEGITFNTNLPCPQPTECNNVVFARLSGEIANYNVDQNKICIVDNSTGRKRSIVLNKIGAVDVQQTC